MKLDPVIERAKSILLTPREAWLTIRDEPDEIIDLYKNYLIYIATIPAVAIFIGQSIVKYRVPFEQEITYIPIGLGLSLMIRRYLLYLIGVFVAGYLISRIAPYFQAQKDVKLAVKLVGYSATPGWIASGLYIIPRLGDLSVFGYIFGIYLFYTGATTLLDCPEERATSFTIVSLLILMTISILVSIFTSP